jgi:WD40 repeat protein
MRLRLSSGQLEPERFKLSAAGGALALSAGGGVVVAFEKRTLWAWRAGAPSLRRPLTLSGSKAFSAAAVDGDDDRLAVGDASGRITVWRGLASALSAAAAVAAAAAPAPDAGGSSRGHASGGGGGGGGGGGRGGRPPPPPTSRLLPPLTLHWHSAAVRALRFSPDGELLLSGGVEGVLAWWRLAACAASVAGAAGAGASRGFLPRLGGAITSIDAARGGAAGLEGSCVLAQADNTIRKVNLATAEVEASVHGLRPRAGSASPPSPSSAPSSSSPSGSAVDPFEAASPTAALCPLRSSPGDLVVAAPGSALQFWSSRKDAHAARLAVSRRNDVTAISPSSSSSSPSASDATAHAATPRVTGLAFSGDGRGMATAEAVPRPGAGGGGSTGAAAAAAAAGASALGSPSLAGRAGVLKLWASLSYGGVSVVAGTPPYALVAEVVDPHRYGMKEWKRERERKRVEKRARERETRIKFLGRYTKGQAPVFFIAPPRSDDGERVPVAGTPACAGHAE